MLSFVMMLMLVTGSDDPNVIVSRAEELQQARESKALNLRKSEMTFLEGALHQVKERRLLERFQEGVYGFRPLLGGLQTGSGFAAGSSFEKYGFRASAQASLKGYEKYELQFTAPRLLHDRLFAEMRAAYRDAPQERFFGVGKDSREEDRTDYRFSDTEYSGRLGFQVAEHVKAGFHGGWLEPRVGGGTDTRFPSIQETFAAGSVPGLDSQPNYAKAGAFFEVDYRDNPGNPRAGGRYSAQWTSFNDVNLGQFDFKQYDVEVNQYFPFLNERRIFALRAKTTLTRTADGQLVPFYMQPALGGADDLRGFREYRFRHNNMVVLNAEYRWEAFSGLDLALFMDAGQVAAKPTDIDFADLQKSYGFGFRFNTAKSVFLRMDVGLSKEGRQIFLKFSHTF